MSEPTISAQQLRGIALTIVIGATFAGFWGLSGSAALPGAAGILTALLVLSITVGWLGVAYTYHRAARQRPAATGDTSNPFRTRAYRIAVIAQCIAIPVAGRLLTAAGRTDAIMPAVALIVGLHFFGLVPAFQSWRFAVVGGAMALLALISLTLSPQMTLEGSGQQLGLRAAVVGLGCAVILWGGILPVVVATRRQLVNDAA